MRFFNKRRQSFKPFKQVSTVNNNTPITEKVEETVSVENVEENNAPLTTEYVEETVEQITKNNVSEDTSNKTKKRKKNMDTKQKVEMAQQILNNEEETKNFNFKRIKKDKGLIERTESSKTIITEDNKELLVD